MIPKFRFFNMKLNNMFNVINIDLYNEQVDCVLEKRYSDVITWDIKDGSLMQSTGLMDVNGVEIFEGDIVRCFIDLSEYEWIGKVEKFTHDDYPAFDIEAPNGFWYESNIFSHVANSDEELEIIGNVHEHKHLLKEEDNS